jgi:hypothetical protein
MSTFHKLGPDAPPFSLETLKEKLHPVDPSGQPASPDMKELTNPEIFRAAVRVALLSKLTTKPELIELGLKLPSDILKNNSDWPVPAPDKARTVIHMFRAATAEQNNDASSGNKPPSQPERCAQPEAKPVLPNLRHRVAGHRPR